MNEAICNLAACPLEWFRFLQFKENDSQEATCAIIWVWQLRDPIVCSLSLRSKTCKVEMRSFKVIKLCSVNTTDISNTPITTSYSQMLLAFLFLFKENSNLTLIGQVSLYKITQYHSCPLIVHNLEASTYVSNVKLLQFEGNTRALMGKL